MIGISAALFVRVSWRECRNAEGGHVDHLRESMVYVNRYSEFPAVLVSNYRINSLRDNCK